MSRTVHLAPFRAALRFARRDAWAAKGHSALIMAMIAIPFDEGIQRTVT